MTTQATTRNRATSPCLPPLISGSCSSSPVHTLNGETPARTASQRPIRTSTPSRYLKRAGIIPKCKELTLNATYHPTILSSSSSASSQNSSLPTSPSSTPKSSLVKQQSDSLPGLTASNLTQLMSQLNCSASSIRASCFADPYSNVRPQNQLEEVSRFSSDNSSEYSDSDSCS